MSETQNANSNSVMKRIQLKAISPKTGALRGAKVEDDDFKNLLASVRKEGVLKPILVNDNGDGTYTLVDGLQRFTAASMVLAENSNAPDSIDAKVIKTSSENELALQIMLNSNTVKTRPVEYAEGIMRILAHHPEMTQAEIADRLAMSQPKLSMLLKLTNLAGPIKQLVDKGDIKVTNAYVLAKLDQDDQDQFIEAAMTDSPEVFTPKINEFIKKQRAARTGQTAPTGPEPKVRRKTELVDKFTNLQTQASNNPDDPVLSAQVNLLAWVIQQDEDSVSAWKSEQAKQETEKNKKVIEAAEKKAAEAKKAAEEARKKMAEAQKETANV